MDLSILLARFLIVAALVIIALLILICWRDIKLTIEQIREDTCAKVLRKSQRYGFLARDVKERIVLEYLDENGFILERRKNA